MNAVVFLPSAKDMLGVRDYSSLPSVTGGTEFTLLASAHNQPTRFFGAPAYPSAVCLLRAEIVPRGPLSGA